MPGAPSPESGSALRRPGRFSYDRTLEEWQWDDEVYRIHGHEPGAIVPTLDLILECADPSERDRVATVLGRVLRAAEAAGISYRLLAADGAERSVVLVAGATKRAPDDPVVDGYYVDLTATGASLPVGRPQPRIAAPVDPATAVEQATDAIMVAYEVDADAALVMLRWWSRHRNLTVPDLATRLTALTQGRDPAETDAVRMRTAIDTLLQELAEAEPPHRDGDP